MRADILKRNNVKVLGNGTQPMLFAHGFGCDQNMWRFVTPAFEQDYKIILFDYVGAGNSDHSAYVPERYASLQGYAQDLLDVCEALDLENVILVGHSVSSMIGLLAAIQQPHYFERLVMVGPSPCYINEGDYVGGFEKKDIEGLLETMEKNYIGWANFLAPNIMNRNDKPELGEELTQSFCSTDPVIARQFAEATFFFRQPERSFKNGPAGIDTSMLRRYYSAGRGGPLPGPPPAQQYPARNESHRPLSPHERTGRNHFPD